VLSNTFQNVTGLGIYLGTGTSHCLVMGNGNTTIQNLGSDNVILGKVSTPKTIGGPTPQLPHPGWSGAHR
jgi:hypothetical protein